MYISSCYDEPLPLLTENSDTRNVLLISSVLSNPFPPITTVALVSVVTLELNVWVVAVPPLIDDTTVTTPVLLLYEISNSYSVFEL